jgi:hypothetical protein
MNDIERSFNLLEAALWSLIALAFAWNAWRTKGTFRRLSIILGAAFALFGLSDVIESRTGAWYHPWWLLAMKGACVVVFAWSALKYRGMKKGM